MGRFGQIAFTPAVKAYQEKMGSRSVYARGETRDSGPDLLGPEEAAFLAERDSFYMASVGEGGWPYVQHRGGPKGFVKVLDARTIAFADFRGNRQYVSTGNVGTDDRVALIFVDYPNQARLKVLAHAKIVEPAGDPALFEKLQLAGYGARVERAFVLTVEGFDWNCPQHITPRFTEDEIRALVAPMQERLAALEAENERLRAKTASK